MGDTTKIRKYGTAELISVIPDDKWAVRDEAMRRYNEAAKKLAKYEAEIAEARKVLEAVNKVWEQI